MKVYGTPPDMATGRLPHVPEEVHRNFYPGEIAEEMQHHASEFPLGDSACLSEAPSRGTLATDSRFWPAAGHERV